jgi:hypothetical protein
MIRVNVAIGTLSDGRVWQGIGMEPDIEIQNKIEAISREIDTVLLTAPSFLKQKH